MRTTLTIEQSARLIKLGVPESVSTFQYCKAFDNPDEQYPTIFRLEDLLRILPKKITDRRNIYNLEIGVWDSDDGWTICYRDRITGTDDLDTYQESRELIDAVYAEICFLKTNNVKEL